MAFLNRRLLGLLLSCNIYFYIIGTTFFSYFITEMPCTPLTDVDHGHLNISTPTNQSIGTVVRVTCNAGYRIEGNPIRECMEYGRWNMVKC